ncbi:MMPL family transporter [Nocardioides sp.]|uniref:MMPL family transporter n=1 Tax=Nocardioides sp. TaxID=35761 RepID=UPI002ED9BF3A
MTTQSPHDPPQSAGPTPMERLAGWSQRRHWRALALWIALVVGVAVAAQATGDEYANGSDVSLPGTQSQQLADLLEEHAPQATGDSVTVVLHDERGWDTAADVDALTSRLGSIAHVDSVTPPDPQQGTVSPDGTLALVEVGLDGESADAPAATYEAIIDVAKAQGGDGLQVEVQGWGIRKVESAGGGAAEGAGMLAALLILVFMFGSLLAATLPLITATLAVGTTFGLAMLVSHLISIPDYATSLLVLVGLGVGIDYALLVFSRFRSELLAGADRARATRRALDTAGRSVLFAGASVIIALLGMFTLGVAGFEGTVTAVALTVLITMVASITLLPALLTVFGRRLETRIRAHAAKRTAPTGEGWRRWAGLIQRAPWPAVVVAVVALGALALPAIGLRLGLSDAGTDPTSTTARAAYDLVSEKLGPGANGPLLVAVEGSARDAQAVQTRLAETPGIVADRVSPPAAVADGVWLLRAEPVTGPQDAATADVVENLREELGDPVLIGGQTAAGIDFSQALAERFPLFVVVVVALSGLLLMSVFRSVAIAVKAALLNLLSIGAALGAMRLVFQDGRFGADAGPIEAFLPVFIFAIVFGLSMDYEVFLLSRMREEWLRTGDPQRAVREGLAHTGGVITAAAAIMVVIFGSFVLFPDRMLQQAGFAMAVAVLLDAVVIRCLVVPAVMRLLGARAWWLPRVLDRWLPHLHVEGRPDAAAPGADHRDEPVLSVRST